jgi:hypothetical protein
MAGPIDRAAAGGSLYTNYTRAQAARPNLIYRRTVFFIAGILLSHHRLSMMDDATFAAEGYSHFLPFLRFEIVFAVAYLFALRYRHLQDAHGRFMLLTGIPLIDPVAGRVLFLLFSFTSKPATLPSGNL